MTISRRLSLVAGLFGVAAGLSLPRAAAWAGEGIATPWQTGFQPAYSPTMERITAFKRHPVSADQLHRRLRPGPADLRHLALLRGQEPDPSRTTHNTLIEVIWTVVPAVILVLVAIPSFKLLYFADSNPDAELTIKAIGRQWFWSYEYPDDGNFTFDSYMLQDDELEPGQPRLLQTDTAVVMPVDTPVRLLITASDVLHSFAIPSMGIKLDGVPGRVNETWVQATEEGTYYGQCSELCGTGHSYMPIMVQDGLAGGRLRDLGREGAAKSIASADEPSQPSETARAWPAGAAGREKRIAARELRQWHVDPRGRGPRPPR